MVHVHALFMVAVVEALFVIAPSVTLFNGLIFLAVKDHTTPYTALF